jgi:hypothetical protein
MQDKDMVEVCRYKVCWLGKKERKSPMQMVWSLNAKFHEVIVDNSSKGNEQDAK